MSVYVLYVLQHCTLLKQALLPALQMLNAPQALEATIHHDGHACAQRLTLLHTVRTKQILTYSTFSKIDLLRVNTGLFLPGPL